MTTRRVRVFRCPACRHVSKVDPRLYNERVHTTACDRCHYFSPVLFSWLQEPDCDGMSDRAMLELAGQAEGGRMRWFEGKMHRVSGSGDWPGIIWDPLVDDGDSRRLEVNMLFQVTQTANGVRVDRLCSVPFEDVFVPAGDDRLAATRRAVVRAAALFWINRQEALELERLKEAGNVKAET